METLLTSLIAGQETPASAAPWVEYVLYGGLGLIILIVLVRALRKAPAPARSLDAPDDPEDLTREKRDADALEAEARRAFNLPQVMLGDSDAGLRVRLAPQDEAPAPTGSVAEPPEAAPEAERPRIEIEAPVEEGPPPVEAAGKTLREGLARTHDGFVKKLGKIFGSGKALDDDMLGALEEALFTADIGVRTAQKLVAEVYEGMSKRALKEPERVWRFLKGEIANILRADLPPLDLESHRPTVIMVVGVNGAGKTTSIGKLAHTYQGQGKKVMLAAGDTFRAAAVEQLEVWGQRAGVPVVKGKDGQDPSSVIFDACRRAQDEGYDIIIADTAGRLQAKKELMDELAKIHRVIGKAIPGAPHEVWLVLDATNGQNAISQAKTFTDMVAVTGIVLTKLDGTAKGGVVIGITDEMKLPVRYIGIGEKVEDLRAFDAGAFVEALFAGA